MARIKKPQTEKSKQPQQTHWLVGRTVVEVRDMTPAEMAAEMWSPTANGPPRVLMLDDGTRIYPSCDPEGNGPGCLFGQAGGKSVYV